MSRIRNNSDFRIGGGKTHQSYAEHDYSHKYEYRTNDERMRRSYIGTRRWSGGDLSVSTETIFERSSKAVTGLSAQAV